MKKNKKLYHVYHKTTVFDSKKLCFTPKYEWYSSTWAVSKKQAINNVMYIRRAKGNYESISLVACEDGDDEYE